MLLNSPKELTVFDKPKLKLKRNKFKTFLIFIILTTTSIIAIIGFVYLRTVNEIQTQISDIRDSNTKFISASELLLNRINKMDNLDFKNEIETLAYLKDLKTELNELERSYSIFQISSRDFESKQLKDFNLKLRTLTEEANSLVLKASGVIGEFESFIDNNKDISSLLNRISELNLVVKQYRNANDELKIEYDMLPSVYKFEK